MLLLCINRLCGGVHGLAIVWSIFQIGFLVSTLAAEFAFVPQFCGVVGLFSMNQVALVVAESWGPNSGLKCNCSHEFDLLLIGSMSLLLSAQSKQ